MEPKKKGERYLGLKNYSDSLGCTAFQLLIHSPLEILSDPQESYLLAGSEWLNVIFQAQKEITKRCRLKPRKLILTGRSLGGTFVERVAAARPENVAAVAFVGAPEISVPVPAAKSDAVWFLGINRGDSMRSAYEELFQALVRQRRNLIFSIFPPNFGSHGDENTLNYHGETAQGNEAQLEFLKGVIERQSSTGENDLKKWPFVRDRANPVGIFASNSQRAKGIPELRQEFLPSKSLVNCLQDLPALMQTVQLNNPVGKSLECLVGLPPLGKPVGVAIYLHKPGILETGRFIDNIYFLAGKGFLVIAPKVRTFDESDLQTVAKFVKSSPLMQALPLAYVGIGEVNNPMWRAIADRKLPSPNVVTTIGFRIKDDFDPKKLPHGGGVKCPLLFVYDERPMMNVATVEEVQDSLSTVSSAKAHVNACRVNGQFARIAVIAAPNNGVRAPLSDQQAINYVGDFILKVATQRMRDITLP